MILVGICQCGCGKPTRVAAGTNRREGYQKGQPRRFLKGHALHAMSGRPLAERFWSKVNKNGPIPAHCPELGPCYLWTGQRQKSGYGQIKVGRKMMNTHRVGWIVINGPMPADKPFACHHCDNYLCVRDTHVYPGTVQDNNRDARIRGRAPRFYDTNRSGERNGRARLSRSKVDAIRAAFVRGEISYPALAALYGVSPRTIKDAAMGRRWP